MIWSLPLLEVSRETLARTTILPRPVRKASSMPWVPKMMPAVGKSGPCTMARSSSKLNLGLSMTATMAPAISLRLCGGMLVAMPTAMPLDPLTSRNGRAEGSTRGSCSESS